MSALIPAKFTKYANAILRACEKKGLVIATAESCTGGLLSAVLTEAPGSSKMFRYGFVAYHNKAKTKLIGVSKKLLKAHGAVSDEVARAMAKGALRTSGADLAIAITGIAGPGGGSKEKPVGTVYVACVRNKRKTISSHYHFKGTRSQIRLQSVEVALDQITQQLK